MSRRSAWLAVVIGLFGMVVTSRAFGSESPVISAPIDRAVSLRVDEEPIEYVVHASAETSFDGKHFDANSLFDFAAGGLRVRSIDANGTVHATATNKDAHGCIEAGVVPPCLVPALAPLAHERLLTVNDFRATLHGHVDVQPIAKPFTATSAFRFAAFGVGAGAYLIVIFGAMALVRSRRKTPFGEVLVAAREARKAIAARSKKTQAGTSIDPTVRAIYEKIEPLVARAHDLEDARIACAKKLRDVDVKALNFDHERAEAARLQSDLEESKAGLARIASALRTIALAVREGRNVRAKSSEVDPISDIANEIALRDEAIAEID